MSWREIALGEAIRVKHGYAFKGEFFAPKGSHLVVTPGNFHESGGLRVREGKERFYIGDIPEDFVLAKDDLIVAMTEQGEGLLGSSAWIPEDDFFLHNQRIGLISECDEAVLHKRYLYWLFNTPSIRSQIRASATGAKVKHTAPERLYKVRVSIPDIAKQQRITALLDNLDEDQAVLLRQISLLEEAARLIYTEWFVRQRFPRHQQTPSNGGIPQGWRNLHFQDVADLVGGGTPSTDRADYWDGDILWVTPTDITRNNCLALLDTQRKITEQGLENSNARLLPPRSILMTSRASIGYFALCDGPASTNQGFICLVPHAEEARYFLLFNLMSRKEEIESMATGATFKEISKKTFRTLPLLMPSSEVLLAFNEAITPIIDQIFTLKRQLISLRQARDLLLPRLISGQLRL